MLEVTALRWALTIGLIVGLLLLELFSFMFVLFGLVLVVTAVQLYRHRDVDPDVGDNGLVAAGPAGPAGL